MVPPASNRNEAETRAELIYPALEQRGWSQPKGMIGREVSAGTIEMVGVKPRRRKSDRADYSLRVLPQVPGVQDPELLTLALIEAKRSDGKAKVFLVPKASPARMSSK